MAGTTAATAVGLRLGLWRLTRLGEEPPALEAFITVRRTMLLLPAIPQFTSASTATRAARTRGEPRQQLRPPCNHPSPDDVPSVTTAARRTLPCTSEGDPQIPPANRPRPRPNFGQAGITPATTPYKYKAYGEKYVSESAKKQNPRQCGVLFGLHVTATDRSRESTRSRGKRRHGIRRRKREVR